MKLLHILATPREHESNTLRISNAFIEGLHSKYVDLSVEVIDLFNRDLPAVAGDNIEAKYTVMIGSPVDKRHEDSWQEIEFLIDHFSRADVYLISAPMWNFSIPYALKYYIDAIIQPGYMFKYNEKGQAIGLITGKKMVCVTTRGGDYSEGSPFYAYDFQEPYLRAIFGFIGITEIQFINAQPMDVTPELREAAIKDAIKKAKALAENFDWGFDSRVTSPENPQALKPPSLKR